MGAELPIGDEESSRQTTYRHKPGGIGKTHSRRAGPKVFLVRYEILCEARGALVCARRCHLQTIVHHLRIPCLVLFASLRRDLAARLAATLLGLRGMRRRHG